MKSEVFNTEIKYIKDNRLRDNLVILLNLLPDYFYEVPASSTGKYHPSFSLGNGGLVRHVKVATRIAIELFNNEALHNFNDKEKDLLLMSIILHDGLKSGLIKSEYSKSNHPILMANFIKDNEDKLTLEKDEIDFITSCIETHMGPWTKDYDGNEILRKPTSKYERFVHMCDYLSSRKFLDVKFKENEIDLN
jgi:hypothetical protein